MVKRLLPILLVTLVLISVLIYSQMRVGPLKVSGYIEADEIRLGSRVGGRVEAVLVEEGDQVHQGQELIKLEPYDLKQREQEAVAQLAARQAAYDKLSAGYRTEEIDQAQANYDQLQAHLELLQNGPRPQEIEAARGRLDVAKAEFVATKRRYDRAIELRQNDAISIEDYDSTEQLYKAAQSLVTVREKELEIVELGSRDEEIAEAKANLAQASAAWELAKAGYRTEEVAEALAARDAAAASLAAIREQLAELTIRSPVEGTIESLDLRPGDLVGGSAPVLSLIDRHRLWVRAYVPENRLNLKLGQTLEVAVDSYPEERFRGELTYIARRAEFTPNNVQTPEERSKQVFRIKVTLDENAQHLRPGMSADVWLSDPDTGD